MVELDTAEINKISNLFDQLPSKFDMNSIKQDLTEIIRSDLDMRFILSPATTQGGYAEPPEAGVFWEPLKASTLQSRPHRKGGQLLIDTEHLKDSLTLPNGPDQFIEIYGDNFVYRTDVEYGESVQELRPYMFFHRTLVDSIADVLMGALYISNDN